MKNTKIILLLFLSLVIVSCDKDFEEINTDPDNPTSIPAHLILGNLIRINQNAIYNVQGGGDMGECWAQHWSKVQYNSEARYIPRRGVIDGIWNTIYASVLSDAKTMYEIAGEEGNTNLQAISLVLQANSFQILTDLYGPIPFAEALDPAIEQPTYSTSEEVYAGILTMLDQADALFASGTGEITSTSDLMYAGDVSKWEKFGNSLKFKVLMRSNGSSTELQALVNEGKMFASNDDSAQLVYNELAPDANPIYETIVDSGRGEYKISSPVVDILTGLADPRLEIFAGLNVDNAIVGKPAGYTDLPNDALGYTYGNISPIGDKYLDPTLPGVMLSYSQLQLLMAEAANEGKIGGGLTAAKTYMVEGIIANFDFNGALDGATYADGIPLIDQADAREKIATQVWISLFGQGFEAWTEWRRTGYPTLTPAIDGANGSIPTRLYYPTTEISLNQTNYEAAKATLNNGDELTSTLFWQ